MSFEQALELLKAGIPIKRKVWDKKEYLSMGFIRTLDPDGPRTIIRQVWDGPEKVIMKWKPHNEDILAEDWELL